MRVLRSSQYPPPDVGGPPLTIVMRDSDVVDTLESIRLRAGVDGTFCAFDLFDMPDASIVDATLRAEERLDNDRRLCEHNQATMYYWLAGFLMLMQEQGLIVSDKPAPLTPEEMRVVYEQVLRHPNYKGQTLRAWAEDGTEVGVENGEIK